MPRLGSGAPTYHRGVSCTQGHDDWRKLAGGNGRWRCVPCDRKWARESVRRSRRDRPASSMLRLLRARAQERGLSFTITAEDIVAAWPRDGKCPALGILLVRAKGYSHDASPSVDRVNPARGYEPDNIVVISLRANRAKSNLAASELEAIAAWMRHHTTTAEEKSS